MPTIPPMPQTMTAVLPFLALIVTSWLQHSTAPKWLNVLIALLFPLGLATIWAVLGDALTPNLSTDITILVTLCYALMALSDMAGLRQWLQDTLTSPMALFVHQSTQPEPQIASWAGPPVPYQSAEAMPLPSSRTPQFATPSPSLHSGQTTQPMAATSEPATPVEESPAKS